MTAIRVILIEDNILFRTSLKEALESKTKGNIKVIGEVSDRESTLKLIKEVQPDIILLNAYLADASSLELVPKLLRWYPDSRIITMTPNQIDPLLSQFFKLGVLGCFTKNTPLEEAIRAIQTVNAGQRYLTSAVATEIALRSVTSKTNTPLEQLSSRETQIMLLVVQGLEVAAIGEKLHLSPKTVCSYRYRIFDKLNVKNDVELIRFAIQHKLINADNLT